MKPLKDILQHIQPIEIVGSLDKNINKVFIDSTKIKTNSLFIAIKGNAVDGHDFIDDAIYRGASAIVCEHLPLDIRSDVTYIKVADTRYIAGVIAAAYYDFPSQKIKVIGVTGTNGKTTIATLLYRLMRLMGYKAGLISTIVNYVDSKMYPATHTTPDPIELQRLLNKMVEAGCRYCFMEVSSHAVVQQRINQIHFSGGIFTNISHDHLDYHKTFDAYIQAKKGFFDQLPQDAFALTNVDDKNGKVMVQNTKAHVYTYALKTHADFHARILEKHLDGTLIRINNQDVWIKLIGEFNVYNMLAIYATACLLGHDSMQVMTDISLLEAADGRFQYFKSNKGVTVIVDYAHTPDALEKVLQTVNDIKKNDSRIITVVGAGGNRDASKRPEMGKIVASLSNISIFTSDNPRNEDPEVIISDMLSDLDNEKKKNILTIVDRKEAIKTAITLAHSGDIVLIAGKGHETYQEIKGVKYPFDDREIVKQYLN